MGPPVALVRASAYPRGPMATPNVKQLQQQVDALASEYSARFAGHPRATRDPNDLSSILARLRGLKSQADTLPGGTRDLEVRSLREVIESNIKLYENEKTLIEQARAGGGAVVEFAKLGTQANFAFARYRRHFANKSRNTRDLGLLAELIEELTKIQASMQELLPKVSNQSGAEGDLKLVTDNLTLYRQERGEIVDARNTGTAEDQANTLAEVANEQFKLYRDHFAGQARATRRPQLLQRMIDNLEQIRDRMQTLRQQGLRADFNDKNIEVVTQNLETYRNELKEIRKVRESTKIDDFVGNLGGAANTVMEGYDQNFAGQDRRTRDIELLGTLCDRLYEVFIQMRDLDRATRNNSNASNLAITTDNLTMLEREYTAVDDAKNGRTVAST